MKTNKFYGVTEKVARGFIVLFLMVSSSFFIVSCNSEEILVDEIESKVNTIDFNNAILKRSQYSQLSNKLNLANYVEAQLQIGTEISILLGSEKNIDIEYLESASEELKPKEILGMLEDANVLQSDIIFELFIQMYNNSIHFTNSNPELKNLNPSEIENMITFEIDKQLDEFYYRSSSCTEAYDKARYRCGRNLTIALSVSAAVGIFTGGMGWGVGAVAAFAISALCLDDAMDDYNECNG